MLRRDDSDGGFVVVLLPGLFHCLLHEGVVGVLQQFRGEVDVTLGIGEASEGILDRQDRRDRRWRNSGGEPIDSVTVAEELERAGLLESVGGLALLL